MPYRCSKKFHFSAAHALTQLPSDHKCHNLHGHNYEVTVTLEAGSLPYTGMVVDFGDISKLWEDLLKPILDHKNLNDVAVLSGMNLTAECLAKFIFDLCRAHWGRLMYSVRVQETPTCWAEYTRDD